MITTIKQLNMKCNDPFLHEAFQKLDLPLGTKEFTVRLVDQGSAIEVEAKHVDVEKLKSELKAR